MEDKYKSLSIPELAGEESFIRWITKGENDDRWADWLKNNPGAQLNVNEAGRIVRSLSFKTSPTLDPQDKAQLWDRIHQSVDIQLDRPKQRSLRRTYWVSAAAATIALLLWVAISPNRSKVYAAAGEKQELILPEQSHVTLNADSKITYSKNQFANKRELYLEGEAFFEVEPGSKFTVNTKHGDVTVVGTSFNIISRGDIFQVACFTGKVNVKNNENKSVDLTAGEIAASDKNDLTESKFESTTKPLWLQGKFYFDDQPLSRVIAELERQYKVKVNMSPDINQTRYTGFFEAGNLNNALYTITWPLHLRYEVRDNTVIISK